MIKKEQIPPKEGSFILKNAVTEPRESCGVLLSIIIPVYNVEPYLEHCLDTVLACDLRACEVILSLGQSDDASDVICARYAQRYDFVRCIRQKGNGLSDARNSALDVMHGSYVLFLDSDDYVDTTCLDEIIATLREPCFSADVIMTDFRRLVYPGERFVEVFQIGEKTPVTKGMSFLPKVIARRQCFWNVWRYVYKFSFLQQHGIRFAENRLSEDVDFTTSVLIAQPDIVFIHSPYYVYRIGRGGSLMDISNLRRLNDTVWALRNSIVRLRDSDFIYAKSIISRFQFEYLLNLAVIWEVDCEDRAQAKALYADWREVLAGSEDIIVRAVALLLRLCGVGFISQALYRCKQIKHFFRRTKGRTDP